MKTWNRLISIAKDMVVLLNVIKSFVFIVLILIGIWGDGIERILRIAIGE